MIKLDDVYLQDTGDVVISIEGTVYLILGSNSLGQQQGYTLFDMRDYQKDDMEYLQVLAKTAIEYMMQRPLQRNRIWSLGTSIPKSIAFNYFKGFYFQYLMEVPKEDLTAWLVKSKMFGVTLQDVSYSLYELCKNYRDKKQQLATVEDDSFKKFAFYRFLKSGKKVVSLGRHEDSLIYVEIAMQEPVTDKAVEKHIEKLYTRTGKILMSDSCTLKRIEKYDYELTDELKEKLIKAVNARGLKV